MPPRSLLFLKALLLVCCLIHPNHVSTKAQSRVRQEPPPTPTITAKSATPVEKAAHYSQEAFVVEQLLKSYRFEKDGTGQRELSMRVRVQTEAGLERFGQLVFAYSSANENLDVDF